MKYYLKIRSSMGSGKSTIAEKLSSELRTRHIAVDRVLDDPSSMSVLNTTTLKIFVCYSKNMNGNKPAAPIHPSGINQIIVNKVFARRGRLHAFPTLDPKRTALVVIDLDTGTVTRVNDEIRIFVPLINDLSTALRKRGGTVAWVTTPIQKATSNFKAIYGQPLAERYEQEGVPQSKATVLWHELSTNPQDIYAVKTGASAFFPGKSNLHQQLQGKDIDTILIVGAVTNVCCEASARDAAELEYKVTMISDALWGHGNGLHEATLATFFRNYGDVRPASEVLSLIG